MSIKAEQFLCTLKTAIDNDKLVLPTLPEVALKIRETVESKSSSAQQIADVLKQDASLSARVLQVANSPFYRSRQKVEDIQTAVTRLGMNMVRDIVVRLAMKQMFQATTEVLDLHFRQSWNTAVEVAAISRMLATTIRGINPEQALLAGLVHNIGALPILVLAENDADLFNNAEVLGQLIYTLQNTVGKLILTRWNFTGAITDVVTYAHDFSYSHDGQANLTDIVQVALLQGAFVPEQYAPDDWNQVPAFQQLGIDTEINVVEIEENKLQIEQTKESLQV